MQVAGDPVAVLEHGEPTAVLLGPRELQRQRRVAGERRHHVHVGGVEAGLPVRPGDDQDAEHVRT